MSHSAVFRSRVEAVMQSLMESAVRELVQLLEETYCSLQTEVYQTYQQSLGPPAPKGDGGSPFPVVGEVLGVEEAQGFLWRRPISPSSPSADEGQKEEEEDSLPVPSTPTMDEGQRAFSAETVVFIKEEPEDFEFEGCGEVPFPSQSNQNHTNTNAAQPHNHCPTEEETYKPKRKVLPVTEFTCNFCKKTFMKLYKLAEHERKCKPRHVVQKELTCKTCGRQFERPSDLSRHLKFHRGEKPYSCSYCGKQFVFDKSCRSHERRDHNAMGYWCSDCGKTFREREEKDEHKCMVFKGECAFPCSECIEGFSRQYLLKKHQLEFHPEIFVEKSQRLHTEMDSRPSAGTNPADAAEQNMEEMKEDKQEEEVEPPHMEPFDPEELVPPSLELLEMDEMVQPGDYMFGLPANSDNYVENTNHGSTLNSDNMDNLKHGSPAKEGVSEHTNSGLTARVDRSRDSSSSELPLQDNW